MIWYLFRNLWIVRVRTPASIRSLFVLSHTARIMNADRAVYAEHSTCLLLLCSCLLCLLQYKYDQDSLNENSLLFTNHFCFNGYDYHNITNEPTNGCCCCSNQSLYLQQPFGLQFTSIQYFLYPVQICTNRRKKY